MKIQLIIICTLLYSAQITAQYHLEYMRENPNANFYEIESAVDAFYKDKEKGRGSGYKQYKRWAILTEPYVYPSGEMKNYQSEIWGTFKKFQKNQKPDQRSYHGFWSEEGPNHYVHGNGWNGGNGRVNCIAFDPNTEQSIYVGTPAGGMWHSPSGGTNWTPLTDGLPTLGVSGIAINYEDPDIMYMLTGDGDGNNMPSVGVLKSVDAGQTWQRTGLSWGINWDYPNTIHPYKLLMHPDNPNILFVAASNGIWRTSDGGHNWTCVWSLWTWDIEFNPNDTDIMYATGGSFFRSQNEGLTWGVEGDPDFPAQYSRIAVAVSPANADNVYLLFGGNQAGVGTFSGFYLSTDTGLDFELQSATPNILGYPENGQDDEHQSSYDLALVIDPSNPDIVYTGGVNVWKSENAGVDWEIISHWYESGNTVGYTHADIHALEIWDGNLYCGSDGGVFVSTDDGNSWQNLSGGLGIMQFYSIDISSNVFSGGTQDNGCNQWNSGSMTATHSIGADGFACLIDYSNPNIRYQSDQDIKYRSTNGGLFFSPIGPIGVSNYWNSDWIMDPSNPSTLFLAQQQIWRTTTGGVGINAWQNLNAGFTNGRGISSMAQGVFQPRMLYASDKESLRRTRQAYDWNPTWTDISTGLPTDQALISGIAVDPLDSNRVWVTFSGISAGNKVFHSPDAGLNWFNESGSLPNVPVNCIKHASLANDELYIGTDIGMFYRNDDIGDWIYFSNGLPATRVLDLDIENEKIYTGTHGRGIWSSDLFSSCPIHLVLTPQNDPSNPFSTGKQIYHASNSITSSRMITGGIGTDVQYKGGIQTILTEGFWIKTNNQLLVTTEGCPE